MKIPFNKPCYTGKEAEYLRQAVETGKLSGNGEFTRRCQDFFEERYGFKKCLLTTSCTDALEMAAILTGVGPGDEVIVPSYTFVSSALAFVRTGATIVFADSCADQPNIDADKIEALVTPRTKVIVPVHYAGCACDMDKIMSIAERCHLLVVEDAAQAVDSFHLSSRTGSKKPLGGIGHLAAFSFHETKNITSGGEGGMLVVNDDRFIRRAEIIWEKGTNRAEFFRGEVNKYGWVDTGSSFLASELNAAYLWAQLENLDEIQSRRKAVWNRYYDALSALQPSCPSAFRLPVVPPHATNNAHMFYLLFENLEKRSAFIKGMRDRGLGCPFHYLPLHSSEFMRHSATSTPYFRPLPNCDRYADCLVRLPLHYGLDQREVDEIVRSVEALVKANNSEESQDGV